MKKNPKQTVALNKTKPKQHKTALAKKTVIITRYKCTKPYGLPGRKGDKMWGRSFPSMVASIADCIFQGTMWQGSFLLLTMWQKKRTNEKNNPQQLNLNDNKTLSSLNNNQWETRAKKKKKPKKKLGELLVSKTSQMLLSHLLCATGQSLSGWWQVHWQWQLELGQQLELVDCRVQESHFSWCGCLEQLQWKKSKDNVLPSSRDRDVLSNCG